MKPASAAMINLLENSSELFYADLYTITMVGGQVLRYTSWQSDLTIGGHTYSSSGPKITRGPLTQAIGLEAATVTVDFYADTTVMVGSITFASAIHLGLFDGADFEIDTVYMATPGDVSAGTVPMYVGRVSSFQVGRTAKTLTGKTHVAILDVQLPRNLAGPPCTHTLFDSACGLNAAAYAQNETIATPGAGFVLTAADPGQIDGYFALGQIVFTSGVNAGIRRLISASSGTFIVFIPPLPQPCAAGDTVTLYPGCDKSMATCQRFGNFARYGGFPFIPQPETSV